MRKVYVLSPGENWIVDRFVKEWYEDNLDISTKSLVESQVVWLLADWCWNQVPIDILRNRKVLTTVHHIVPEKFGEKERKDFELRDGITTAYHVFNQSTSDFIRSITDKPIHLIPYWANQKIWRKTQDKLSLRKKYNIPIDSYVIGSFQRDTEGHDLVSPKLEKGPDLLVDFIEKKREKESSVFVVLAGWRRQYVINRLKASSIPYVYYERPPQETVNELYQTLDLYPVSARCEGGPQSLIECGLLGVPVISRNIGISSQVLPSSSINDELSLAVESIPSVEGWELPRGYEVYRNLLMSI
jgi:hypothetical protein